MSKHKRLLKNFLTQIKSVIPKNIDINQVDVWFQDESRVGQQGSITRIWHFKGQRPRLIRQQQFEYAYIYGAICPANGNSVGLVLPYANGAGMKLHIEEIAKQIPENRHAVLVVDGASWHQETMGVDKVSLLKLPAYSPELNPVEQVWQWLKQNYLSNRCYSGYEAIVDASCEAWNVFASRVDLVKSIGTREWAKIDV